MTPIESAEAFAARLDGPWVTHVTRAEMADAIRSRDRAIRAEALREAARVCERAAMQSKLKLSARFLLNTTAGAIRALATKEPDDG